MDIKAGVMGGGADRDPEMFFPSTPPFLFTHASAERSGLFGLFRPKHGARKTDQQEREKGDETVLCT